MPFQSEKLSANDRRYFGNFEETLSNAAAGDLESFSQTEEATLKEVKGGKLVSLNAVGDRKTRQTALRH